MSKDLDLSTYLKVREQVMKKDIEAVSSGCGVKRQSRLVAVVTSSTFRRVQLLADYLGVTVSSLVNDWVTEALCVSEGEVIHAH